jgi:hypothetical protein
MKKWELLMHIIEEQITHFKFQEKKKEKKGIRNISFLLEN